MRRQIVLRAFALSFAGLMAAAAARAQPADPNYQAQARDYQAKQRQYEHQQQQYQEKQDNYAAQKDVYDAQRRLYLLGRAEYEAKYGAGSYDAYARTHTTTTTTVSPAGTVESRTTVIEH